MKKQAFTLVELVITITILVILSTIAFVSFQSYTKDSRDANRLSSGNEIIKALHLYYSKNGTYPMPDTPVALQAGSTTNGYQWTVGSNVWTLVWLQQDAKDPLDQKYYSYVVDSTQNNAKIGMLLENEENALAYQTPAFAGYEKRSMKWLWNKLPLFTDTNNTPIQELSLTGINFISTTTSYKAFLDTTSSGIISGTGNTLSKTLSYLKPALSCKDFLTTSWWSGSVEKNGYYMINPTGGAKPSEVYCDMVSDGGGWTLIVSDYSSPSDHNWKRDYKTKRKYDFPRFDGIWWNFNSKIQASEILHINETLNNTGWYIKRDVVFTSYKYNGIEKLPEILSTITGLWGNFTETYTWWTNGSRNNGSGVMSGKILPSSVNSNFSFTYSNMWNNINSYNAVQRHNNKQTVSIDRMCFYNSTWGWSWYNCFQLWNIDDNRINGSNYNHWMYASIYIPTIKNQTYIR